MQYKALTYSPRFPDAVKLINYVGPNSKVTGSGFD